MGEPDDPMIEQLAKPFECRTDERLRVGSFPAAVGLSYDRSGAAGDPDATEAPTHTNGSETSPP
ncbi:hypothetical protein GCM10010336_36600 [Streptomyces goshikiensis]|nr:hypothetical protein GCM10010336_36600 [Streptomyces goshikiensis]